VTRRLELGSGRTTVAVSGAVVVLLLALAALAVWRFRDPSATPATRSSDPLAVLAPAAALTALGVTAALGLGPLLAGVARLSARRAGVGRALATRLAARDLRVLATPTTLLALAVAAGALAAGTAGTTDTFLDASGRIVHGGALRATVGGSVPLGGPSDLLPGALRGRSGAAAGTVPVLRFAGTTPTTTTTVIGTDARALGRVVGVDRATFDARSIADRLTSSRAPGVSLGASGAAVDLTLALRVGGPAAVPDGIDPTVGSLLVPEDTDTTAGVTVSATAWVADTLGDLAPLDTASTTVGQRSSATSVLSTVLPDGGPWRLVAIDLHTRSDVGLADVSASVSGITVGGRSVTLPSSGWTVARTAFDSAGWTDAVSAGRSADGALAVSATTLPASGAAAAGVRIMPTAGRTVPVVVSSALAATAGLRPGDAVSIDGDWAGLRARVTAVVPVVPGTDGGSAVLADLSALDTGMLANAEQPPRVRELWAADAGARSALRAALGGGASISAPTTMIERRFVGLGTDTLLLGVAGGSAFGALALVAAVVTSGRDRRDEARGLRAVGVRSRTQAFVRAFAPGVVVVHGVVAGLVAGVVTLLLVAGPSARSSAPAAPSALPVRIVLDWPIVLLPVAAIAVGGVVVAVATGVAAGRAAGRAGAGVDR
jgi:hypothetical protein